MTGLQNGHDPSRAGFDWRNFARMVRARLQDDGRSMRAVAPEIGVTLSDLSRAAGGQQINAGRVLAICDWIGTNIRSFYLPPDLECSTFDQVKHLENTAQCENRGGAL